MNRTFGPYTVTLSNLDKPLLGNYTKGDLIEYYENIADTMLPYMKNHPLMMHRFPDGLEGDSFYQKNVSDYFPAWIKKVRIKKKDGFYKSVVCQNKATLVYLANQAVITPHLWLSRIDKLDTPDRMIFDLDPSDDDFSKVKEVAFALKRVLDDLKLHSYVMTSGSKGLHIYVPIRRSANFKETKELAYSCASFIIQVYGIGTLELRKDKREGEVFIDYLRNSKGATAAAPYAVRAKPNAPVATPLFWKEVEDPQLHPQKYTIANLFDRLESQKDPWATYFERRQKIDQALETMRET